MKPLTNLKQTMKLPALPPKVFRWAFTVLFLSIVAMVCVFALGR